VQRPWGQIALKAIANRKVEGSIPLCSALSLMGNYIMTTDYDDKCLGNACMADKEWPSINPPERVCIHCPKFAGKDLPPPKN